MKIPVVHHGKKYGERSHDDDPVWMRNAGGEQYRVGYEADIDSPLRILPAGLQTDEIACGHENSETDDGIINLTENHFGMIGDGVQKRKIAEISTVKHIGKAKADSTPGTGNQNPEDENGRERKNRAADDLPDLLLTKKKQRKKDQQSEHFQRDSKHKVQYKALPVIPDPAGYAQNGEIQGGNIISTQNDDGGHEQIGGIEQDAGKQSLLFLQFDGYGKTI